MDLLKTMIANRAQATVVHDPKPRYTETGGRRRTATKAERAKANAPGSKAMRTFIIEEKPGKKVVKEHLEAIIAAECASSDED
jgi:hypothetical protein